LWEPNAPALRAPVPSLHHQLGQSIFSRCDRTGARSISSVRGSQRRDLCLGHRVPGLAPALARASCVTAARLVLAPAARPSPLLHPGAQRNDLLLGTVARACPMPGARAHDSIPKSGATQSTLPCRGASLASAFSSASGVHLVLASDATAWSLHPGKRRRQLTVASATIVQSTAARSLAPTSALGRRRARRPRRDSGLPTLPPPHARYARALRTLWPSSPRRVLPPWPPLSGPPSLPRCARSLG
jgi:hypothetical protein